MLCSVVTVEDLGFCSLSSCGDALSRIIVCLMAESNLNHAKGMLTNIPICA